jgi:hypothetical protein
MVQPKKKWYRSKTVLLNLLTIGAGLGGVVQIWAPFAEPLSLSILLTVVGVAGVIVRGQTNQGIH